MWMARGPGHAESHTQGAGHLGAEAAGYAHSLRVLSSGHIHGSQELQGQGSHMQDHTVIASWGSNFGKLHIRVTC